jgi:glycosyltransferase involved in cell wall biosynthesis
MISVVIPCFNEEENLPSLLERLFMSLKKLEESYEIIFIDDGSTDSSLAILKKFSKMKKNIRIFSFRRNQGKSEALTVGFQKARGEYIITLDADLQDKPEEITKLVEKIKTVFDIVSGWRKERQDQWFIIIASKFFNYVTGLLWGEKLHDYNCGFKIYTKEAAKSLHLYGGMYRFIPLLAAEQGFTVGEIAVSHDKRKFGKSKYGFSKVWKDFPDMFTILFLTRYGKRPLHFFGAIGGILLCIGMIFLGYLTYLHYFLHETVGTRPLWSVGILFILGGIQIFFTGFLADLIINISQSKKLSDKIEHALKYSTDNV